MNAMSTLKVAGVAFKSFAMLAMPPIMVSQLTLWGVYCVTKRNAIIDVGWVFNHFLVGLSVATGMFSNFGAINANPAIAVTLGLLGLWTARLGGFLFTERVVKPYSDSRYEALVSKTHEKGHYLKFLRQFIVQGCLTCVTAFPLYFALSGNPVIGPVQIVGWSIAFLGICRTMGC